MPGTAAFGMGGGFMKSGLPGCLPDAGGINDQCAWLMDAFAILYGEFERKRGEEGDAEFEGDDTEPGSA